MGVVYGLLDDDLRECFDLDKHWVESVPLPGDEGQVEAYVVSAGEHIFEDSSSEYLSFVTQRLVDWLSSRWGHQLRLVNDFNDDDWHEYHVTSGRFVRPSWCFACMHELPKGKQDFVVCRRWEGR